MGEYTPSHSRQAAAGKKDRIVPQLSVNIDHVATIRQARRTYEPDPVLAAAEAEVGGADGITVHLREDRRHIQDDDLRRLRESVRTRLNLEMAATDEMVAIALRTRPDTVMLVPEGRHEVTTEGGLDVVGQLSRIREVISRLRDGGLVASVFIDAEARQVDAALAAGAAICEVHTGPYAHAAHNAGTLTAAAVEKEHRAVADTGRAILAAGMKFNAGHALNYPNVQPIARLPGLYELHIGHAIVSRAVFSGIRAAVAEMKQLMQT